MLEDKDVNKENTGVAVTKSNTSHVLASINSNIPTSVTAKKLITTAITKEEWTNSSCPTCPTTYKAPIYLVQHIAEHHNSNIRCGLCHVDLPSFNFAKAHFKAAHNTDEAEKSGYYSIILDDYKNFFCAPCQKSFSWSHSYLYHIFTVHRKNVINCGTCNAELKDSKNTRIHFASCHDTTTQTRRLLKELPENSNQESGIEVQQQPSEVLPIEPNEHEDTAEQQQLLMAADTVDFDGQDDMVEQQQQLLLTDTAELDEQGDVVEQHQNLVPNNTNTSDFIITLDDWKKSFCYKCQTTLSSQNYFMKHVFRLHRKHVRCETCNIKLRNAKAGLKHFNTIHRGKKPELVTDSDPGVFVIDPNDWDRSFCYKCKATFIKYYLKNHIYRVHRHDTLSCSTCNVELNSQRDALIHFSSLHSAQEHHSIEGGNEDLEQHQENPNTLTNASTDKFSITADDWRSRFCYKCEKKSASMEYFLYHIFTTHRSDIKCCSICNFRFENRETIPNHLLKCLPAIPENTSQQLRSQKIYASDFLVTVRDWNNSNCYNCKKNYASPNKFLAHVLKSHCNTTVRCNSCFMELNDLQNARDHLKTHLFDFSITPVDQCNYFCYKCQKKFASQGYFIRHVFKVHHRDTVGCDTCSLELNESTEALLHLSSSHQAKLKDTYQEPRKDNVSEEQILNGTDDSENNDRNVEGEKTSLSSFTETLMNGSESKCQICNITFESRYATLMHFVETHKKHSPEDTCSNEEDADAPDEEGAPVEESDVDNGNSAHEDEFHEKGSVTHPLPSVHKTSNAGIRYRKTSKGCKLCKVCRKMVLKNAISAHLAAHKVLSNETETSCPECKAKFKTKAFLRRHTNLKECAVDQSNSLLSTSAFQCSKCNRGYRNEKSYRQHITTDCIVKRRIQDTSVNSSFPSLKYQCQYCSRKFKTLAGKFNHTKCTHNKSEKLGTKGKSIKNTSVSKFQGNTRTHDINSKPQTLLQCRDCSETFNSYLKYEMHQRTIHRTTFTSCPVCEMKFRNYHGLVPHYPIHRKEYDNHKKANNVNPVPRKKEEGLVCSVLLYCAPCQQGFVNLSGSITHYTTAHTDDRGSPEIQALKKPIQCTACKQTFASYKECRKHSLYVHKTIKINYELISRYNSTATKNTSELAETKEQELADHDAIQDLLVGEKKRKSEDQGQEGVKKCKKNKLNPNTDNSGSDEEKGSKNQVVERNPVLNYVCNICQHVISDRLLFRQHREKAHRIRAVWDRNEEYCNICQCEFKSKEKYRFHSEDVHNFFPIYPKRK
ncbi:unnamed protein product [Mucor hiemalis]